MEDQCSPRTLWSYCHEEEGMEELRRALLLATLELQKTVTAAREEISKRDDEVSRLKDLLDKTLKERDTANAKCEKLAVEKLFLQQQQQQLQQQQQQLQLMRTLPLSAGVEINFKGLPDHSRAGLSSSSPEETTIPPPARAASPAAKPLPEKGKLLKAVMEAGPLLQTLLLAGPLPQWQQPPPQLNAVEIPPVAAPPTNISLPLPQDSCVVGISNFCCSKKRGLLPCEFGSNFHPNKYQRVLN